MCTKKSNKLQYTFEFSYTVTTQGVPQPHAVPPPNPCVLFRLSPAEGDSGEVSSVLNICGNREGLEYFAAMLVLTANSANYDSEFHIHLEDVPGVEADMDVTIRAPTYVDILRRREFSEFKGNPLPLPKARDRDK